MATGEQSSMNGYIGYYKGKKFETYAMTTLEAQRKIAADNKIKKPYEITIMLAEKGGEVVYHSTAELGG